ncbi:MFS transporter [Zavarzinia compransoris]|uniref:MFS transporter n=1 Tax=Zavarzinia compransoris TaxID=1264899 RepID=A0A317EC11_9PROT|nr:MFS transporter [Zavarzinia compransoris]PWR23650.1 MFS transporter [Zavarzinia compransoris]TDP47868.1 putative MFS family arabinose efflux permease [Zavarzinia compransoris]
MTTNPGKGALAGLAMAVLLASLGTSIANVALPALAHAFDAPFQTVQWVVIAYLLTVTALIAGAGRLGDLMGRRRLLLAGLALFTLASALAALAPTLCLLIAARALQGAGAAFLMTMPLALASDMVPKDRIGAAMGAMGTLSAIGTALGPSLGGVLAAGFGGQASFAAMAPLGLVAFVLALRFLPAEPARGRLADFDLPGCLLLALALGAYALAMTLGGGAFGALNIALLLGAAALLVLFVRFEAGRALPLIAPGLLADPSLRAGLAGSLLVAAVLMTTLVVGPFYLVLGLGLDAATAGLVMSAGPVVSALTGIPAGRLVDRLGSPRATVAGLCGIGLGTAMLALLPAGLGIAGYVGPLMVTTAAYALFQAANNARVMKGVAPDRRGLVSGLLTLARNLGLVTGATAMGAVFALAAGLDARGAGDMALGLRATFLVAFGLVAAALAITRAGVSSSPAKAP